MRAIVLTRTCEAKDLRVSEVPIPAVKPGWVLVKVKAFGINRSEIILRSYEADADYIKLPRIPGIECVGEIADPSDSPFKAGQRVVALMGGMGRSFDGGYAEYALLPVRNVFATDCDWDWVELAAVPETYYTAWGSLFFSLQLKPGDTFLVRGATSALGLAAMQLAKSIGCATAGTTRSPAKLEFLKEHNADFALLDDGTLAGQVKEAFPDGFSKVLELVGTSVMVETMSFVAYHGYLCLAGILGHGGRGVDPMRAVPAGRYLCTFGSNFPTQESMDRIFAHLRRHGLKPTISRVFALEEIAGAHALMESNTANGKIVVSVE